MAVPVAVMAVLFHVERLYGNLGIGSSVRVGDVDGESMMRNLLLLSALFLAACEPMEGERVAEAGEPEHGPEAACEVVGWRWVIDENGESHGEPVPLYDCDMLPWGLGR
jgi:hypothetical protein